MEVRAIYHAEGEERENHKYVARVLIKKGSGKKPNTYRYFYDKKEYAAYLKGKETAEKISNGLDKLVGDLFSGKSKTANSKSGENFLNNLFKNDTGTNPIANEVKVKITENIEKGKTLATEYLAENGSKSIGAIEDNKEAGKVTVKDFVTTALTSGIGMAVANFVYDAINTIQYELEVKKLKKEAEDRREEESDDITQEPKYIEDNGNPFPDLNLKTEEFTKDEDMEAINPDYDPNDYGTSMNCTYCTAAYDLRQRGYDVEAMEIVETDDPTTMDEVASWYEGVEWNYGSMIVDDPSNAYDYMSSLSNKEIETIVDSLEEYEDGSYGHMMLWWSGGMGGHDVVWEVENGEVKFRDCQTNQVVEPKDYLELCYDCDYFRADNLELADEIERVVRNRR